MVQDALLESRMLRCCYLHSVLYSGLQLLSEGSGLLLDVGVRLAELLGSLFQVFASLLERFLCLAVCVVQLTNTHP